MKDLEDIQAQNPDQGFQFPGLFEITAMGSAGAGLENRVPEVLAGLGLGVLAGSLLSAIGGFAVLRLAKGARA